MYSLFTAVLKILSTLSRLQKNHGKLKHLSCEEMVSFYLVFNSKVFWIIIQYLYNKYYICIMRNKEKK